MFFCVERAFSSMIFLAAGPMCQSQSFKTMDLRNALVGFVKLRKLIFGTTKNPLHEYQYNRLESASKLPTILKWPSPKLVDDC